MHVTGISYAGDCTGNYFLGERMSGVVVAVSASSASRFRVWGLVKFRV